MNLAPTIRWLVALACTAYVGCADAAPAQRCPVDEPLAAGAPAAFEPSPRAPTPRRPWFLAAAGGFLAGDAIALGILGAGSSLAEHAGEDEYLGVGATTILYSAAAGVFAPPALGVLAAGRTPPPAGAVRGFVLGGAAHLAGLLAAGALWRNDERWAAAGVLLAVDLGLAPWLVVRSFDAAADARALEAPAAFARPVGAGAPARQRR